MYKEKYYFIEFKFLYMFIQFLYLVCTIWNISMFLSTIWNLSYQKFSDETIVISSLAADDRNLFRK